MGATSDFFEERDTILSPCSGMTKSIVVVVRISNWSFVTDKSFIKKDRVTFVTVADLPEGGGNTSRLKTLAKVVQSAGLDAEIWNQHALGVAPPELLKSEGTLGGIPFRYALGVTARNFGFAATAMKARAVARIIGGLVRERRTLRGVVLNCLSFYDALPINLVCLALGVRCVHAHEDERFEVIHAGKMSLARKLFAMNSWLGDRVVVRLASSIIVISSYLREKYARLTPHPIEVIPTLIDFDDWPEVRYEPGIGVRRFVYTGALGAQDAMEEVLGAFSRLKDEGKAFAFDVYGDSGRGEGRTGKLMGLAQKLGLSDCVRFHGQQPHRIIKKAIFQADLLVGIRRANQWALSGLSTKLSEYLSSGRATIASSVGDGAGYLRDGENCFLVQDPNRPEAFDDVLRRALESPAETLKRLGENGRQLSREQFGIDVHVPTIRRIFCIDEPGSV
jgi:glycosyltransferase involved in cell wall biosynthesis